MKARHRIAPALLATIALSPAVALACPGAGSSSRVGVSLSAGRRADVRERAAGLVGVRGTADAPAPAPTTHRPGSPVPGALEARRHDDRGPRAPTSGSTLVVSLRDRARTARLSAVTRDRHVVAPAAAFHEAHAPPRR